MAVRFRPNREHRAEMRLDRCDAAVEIVAFVDAMADDARPPELRRECLAQDMEFQSPVTVEISQCRDQIRSLGRVDVSRNKNSDRFPQPGNPSDLAQRREIPPVRNNSEI